eukprot:CAMPEP_0115853394 /NCGR_PEP_ID=MMETSP0287-20121206/13481_1 /TAXON_ID=412157 /ORGANISM="Chrysochromulina rotalis, Strain UIO044" /LENGTH=432 /DNA_ID=CAMNT_0003307469 /DNA_START=29 /DNA_END=1327 /DNA_ORIENTATION=+
MASPSVTSTETYDMRGTADLIRNPPTVHIARGYEPHLPFLDAGRAVICISDWQVEPDTQRHFWDQVMTTLVDELGAQVVSRALVLVAGDMASCSNALRGTKSDAAPDISWLRESIPEGDVLFVYGNHDLIADEQFTWRNPASGLPCLLPHGAGLQVDMTTAVAAVEPAQAPAAALPLSSPVAVPAEASAAVLAEAEAPAATGKTEAERRSWEMPTAEQLADLTKQQRAELWARSRVHGRKRAVLSKSERQQRQHAAQFPSETCAAERLRALHADHPALRPPLESSYTARGGSAAAAPLAAAPSSAAMPACERPLVIGAVHGIPASHTQGLRKIERGGYFQAVHAACAVPHLDVLVTHSNPRLAGQVDVRGEDAPRLHEAFLQSAASLHVHGHMQTDPAVSIVAPGKVVVNADCRVVAFVPPLRPSVVLVEME